MLQLKLGGPHESHATRIAGASSVELERWIERVLTARTVDDVLERT